MIVVVQIVNYTLALLMWMILGRAALGVLTGGRDSLLQRVFDRVTLPVLALTRRVLPFVSERWAPAAAMLGIAALRLALIVTTHPAASR